MKSDLGHPKSGPANLRVSKNSYDEVPYTSYPFAQSHPSRLATIARLFGMAPVSLDSCRVLELGCSSGGNLIPMAASLPTSQFVGIDSSAVEIDLGRKCVQSLELDNVRLEHKNLLDIGPDFGEFDYIIAHGVFSWVPKVVQNHLLNVCKTNLSANGVAYVSYNTYPGWRMRGIVRDMMCFRASRFDGPADRLRQSRALLDFLARSVPNEDNAYSILLRDELNQIRRSEDHYLLHDYLEDDNDPVYFYQFVERAQEHGLQYLGEADYRLMSLKNFDPQVEAMLETVSSNSVEIEQYMDFLRNRMFRQTLLCHEEIPLQRTPSADCVLSMYVASSAKPESMDPIDLHSREEVTFRGPNSVLSTSEPLVKAAMTHLGHVWPQSVPFSTLFATAQSAMNRQAVVVGTSQITLDTRKLAEPLLRCYATAHVEFSMQRCGFVTEVSERPVASLVAREQAKTSATVTNLRHERVTLSEVQRCILPLLDGTNDLAATSERLVNHAIAGGLVVHSNGTLISTAEELRAILVGAVSQGLEHLRKNALLVQ